MRREFSAKTKAAAYKRANGRCERCTAPLWPGKFRYDHDNPDGLTGEPTLENCVVACLACDSIKTPQDISNIARAKRRERNFIGAKTSTRPMPGSRASGIRKRMNGRVERW